MILRESDIKGSRVIRVYHTRRVASLLARALLMHRVVPVAHLEGTMLAEGPLTNSKIVQHLKVVMDAPKDSSGAIIDFVYLVPRHPPMWPEFGFVRFVSYPLPFNSFP
jgi:hypothetical protein